MSYGLYDYDRRRRRRFWTRLLKLVLALGVLGTLSAFSYMVGVEQLKTREQMLVQEIEALTAAKEQAERRAAQLQQVAQTAEIRADEIEVRYQRDVPTGPLAELQTALAQKLAEGVTPERLAFVIGKVGTDRTCTAPETKRFVLPTPLYRGANTSVTFADGAVVITGQGTSARDPNGNPEAWFDPEQPVKIQFTRADGQMEEREGKLPLQHSVVAGDAEYRFTISRGARSFIDISGDRCPFP